MAEVGSVYISVVPTFKGFDRSLRSQMKSSGSIGKEAGVELSEGIAEGVSENTSAAGSKYAGSLKTSLVGSVAKAGIGVAVAGIVGKTVASSIGSAVSRFKTANMFEKQLEGMGYSKDKINATRDVALQAVQGTFFKLGEATSAAAQYLSSGGGPQGLQTYLDVIKNFAASSGRDFGDIATAMTPAIASGKVMGDTLASLETRGIPATTKLADSMGMSYDQVRDAASQGQISVEDFMTAMSNDAELQGMAASVGGTFDGMVANIESSLGRIAGIIVQPIMDAINYMLPGILTGLQNFEANLKGWVDRIKEAFSSVKQTLIGDTPLGEAFQTALPHIAAFGAACLLMKTQVGQNFLGAATTSIKSFTATLKTLPAQLRTSAAAMRTNGVVATLMGTAGKAAKAGLTAMATGLRSVAASLGPLLLVQILLEIFMKLDEKFDITGKIADLLAAAISGIGSVIGGVIGWVGNLISSFSGFGELWNTVWSGIKDFFTGIWEGITSYISAQIEAWKAVFQTISEVWGTVWGAIKDFFTGIWDWLVEKISTTIEIWKLFFQMLSDKWGEIWGAIKDFFVGIWEWLVSTIRDSIEGWKIIFQSIADKWSEIWGAIKAKAADIWNGLKERFSNFVQGIKDKIQTIKGFFTDLAGHIKDAITGAINKVKEIIGGIGDAVKGAIKKIPGVGRLFSDGGAAFAGGGRVRGPGTSTSDSIPAKLSRGEFVINAKSAQRIGYGYLEQLNRFASGGPVGMSKKQKKELEQQLKDQQKARDDELKKRNQAREKEIKDASKSVDTGLDFASRFAPKQFSSLFASAKSNLGEASSIGTAIMTGDVADIVNSLATAGIDRTEAGLSTALSGTGDVLKSGKSLFSDLFGVSDFESSGLLDSIEKYIPGTDVIKASDFTNVLKDGMKGEAGKQITRGVENITVNGYSAADVVRRVQDMDWKKRASLAARIG